MPGVVILAVGCTALWGGAVAWLRTRVPRRRAEPGAPVPAAVLAALRGGFDREDPAVLNTTVFELAERGVLAIEPADSTHPALVRPGAIPVAGTLYPYQVAVVARLIHRQGASGRPVPLSALQPGEDPPARVWHNRFLRELRAEAAERGLLRPATGPLLYRPLLVGGLATSVFIAVAVAQFGRLNTAIPALVFINAAALSVATLRWATRERVTTTGRRLLAAVQNPVPDQLSQLLAPRASALPAAAPAPQPGVRVLPVQLQPLPNHQVWSDYGGDWHPLEIGPTETYSFSSRIAAYPPLLVFAALCLGGSASSFHTASTVKLAVAAVLAGATATLLLGAALNLLRRHRLPRRAVLRGQVAKLWLVKHTDTGRGETYYCALDVGRAPESVRLKIGSAVYRSLQVGDVIEVTVNPRTRRIRELRKADGGS